MAQLLTRTDLGDVAEGASDSACSLLLLDLDDLLGLQALWLGTWFQFLHGLFGVSQFVS